jgi:hypothetical protein
VVFTKGFLLIYCLLMDFYYIFFYYGVFTLGFLLMVCYYCIFDNVCLLQDFYYGCCGCSHMMTQIVFVCGGICMLPPPPPPTHVGMRNHVGERVCEVGMGGATYIYHHIRKQFVSSYANSHNIHSKNPVVNIHYQKYSSNKP